MFRTISNQIMSSKRVLNTPNLRSFHAAVVTTAPRALSTEAASPKVKTPKAPKVKVAKVKVVKEPLTVTVSDKDLVSQVQLIDGIEQLTGLRKQDIHAVLTALPDVIGANIKEGKVVRLNGVGAIRKAVVQGRNLRNIRTGLPFRSETHDTVKIRTSSVLKKFVE